MTDYNDGKWHGWNCEQEHPPINPKSVVDVRYSDAAYDGITLAPAGGFIWGEVRGASIVAFRVVKAYREPREWWITIDRNGDQRTYTNPVRSDDHEVIHVREVLPEGGA